jgi:hypothetical protein
VNAAAAREALKMAERQGHRLPTYVVAVLLAVAMERA